MRVLVVGGGGREHAICRSLAESPSVSAIWCAPGNAGIEDLATMAPVPPTDVEGIVSLAQTEGIDLTVVGPEAPLVAGLADALRAAGLAVFGPSREAARIEGSKAWARGLCERHGIPGPRARQFFALDAATAYVDELGGACVVKADGLAAGKGVTVADDRSTALRALRAALVERAFGDAGASVVVEERLAGAEVSALALTDGRSVVPLPLAQDHKRMLDGDLGSNTGGMGAFSPVPSVDKATEAWVIDHILSATVAALGEEGIEYRGVLYAGLMLTDDGPKVLEFNCRFGDPEAQVILPQLGASVVDLLVAGAAGDLTGRAPPPSDDACVGVVLASRGYPGPVETEFPIDGLDRAAAIDGVTVFHSGTARREGRVVTAGGRVLTVTGRGPSLSEARHRAYEACSLIRFEGMQYRTDIGRSAGGTA